MGLTVMDDVVKIFAENTDGGEPTYADCDEARMILEDAQSPLTTRLVEKMYMEVIEKGHIDFDDIPVSAGDIKAYKGYPVMIETLGNIMQMSQKDGNKDAMNYATIITTAIHHIEALGQYYKEGFSKKSHLLMAEYNLFVFCCVQATSAILSQYVEIVKGFRDSTYSMRIRNSKYTANAFYFQQLEKFNKTVEGTNYPVYMKTTMENEENQFIGSTAVGVVAVAVAILAVIIPLLRSLVYHFYALRTKLSDACALQATYLKFNRTCLEANQMMDQAKRDKVIRKQETVKKIFERMSEKLRVDMVSASKKTKTDLEKENKKFKKSVIQDDVDNAVGGFLL